LVHARALIAHAPTVVDDQTHADGNIFALEDGQFLLDLVFQDAEILLLKSFGEAAAVVDNCGVKDDEVDVDADAAFLPGGILARRRRRRTRNIRNLRVGRPESEKNREKDEQTYGSRKETPSRASGSGRSSRSWSRR
jgi:hypothetical protein